MAITDSAIQQVRARIEAVDADPKQVEAFKQLASQRAQLPDLAAAIGTCVDGGGLRDFAAAYGRLLPSGWDVWLVNDMADQLSDDDELTGEIRKMMRAPQDDDAACDAIDRLAMLIEESGVVSDPTKSGPAYSPVFLSNCWHAQEPQFWQQYTAKRLKTLEALVPELWEQDGGAASHGVRYRVFNRALNVLADTLRIEAWQLTVKLDASPSEGHPLGSGGRYWLMALGKESKHWDSCHAARIAFIGWDDVGDLRQYKSKDQLKERGLKTNDALACWEFCHVMKPGDTIVVKKGRGLVLGHGVVKSDYRFDNARPEYKHVRDVEWLSKTDGVSIRKRPLVTKTLTDITEFSDQVAGAKLALKIEDRLPSPPPHAYTLDDARQDLFLSADEIVRLIALLKRKKNLILQGPPGTGKTYVAQRLAWLLAGARSPDRIEAVQFHQSYGYEDFVRGYRPTDTGGFDLQDGPFLRFCLRAREAPDRPHVLIIDEINRGNLSRIFGELLMLIEADKRDPAWAVRTAYARTDEPAFHVPANLHLVGAMNTADRSLALVDYALRRRFAFSTVEPAFGSQGFSRHLAERDVPELMRGRISARLEALNRQIREHPQLGEGFQVGHSYFCRPPEDLAGNAAWNDWYTDVVRYEIEPLLHEYWFDDAERARSAVDDLLAAD